MITGRYSPAVDCADVSSCPARARTASPSTRVRPDQTHFRTMSPPLTWRAGPSRLHGSSVAMPLTVSWQGAQGAAFRWRRPGVRALDGHPVGEYSRRSSKNRQVFGSNAPASVFAGNRVTARLRRRRVRPDSELVQQIGARATRERNAPSWVRLFPDGGLDADSVLCLLTCGRRAAPGLPAQAPRSLGVTINGETEAAEPLAVDQWLRSPRATKCTRQDRRTHQHLPGDCGPKPAQRLGYRLQPARQ